MDLLRDESRMVGHADHVALPRSSKELGAVLGSIADSDTALTVQGARTGITGGAVPIDGTIINLSRMKEMGPVQADESGDAGSVTVQPGATLDAIREAVAADGLFFPPDPTETTASIGGMVACNASGAMSYHYGPTRAWINALHVLLPCGDELALRRGEQHASGRHFSLTTARGRRIEGHLPSYSVPTVKSAAGYFVDDDMDLIDLFIGSEGTLGIITEIELRLIRKPQAIAGLTAFLPNESAAISLVEMSRNSELSPVAVEFFSSSALDLLREGRATRAPFAELPELQEHFDTAVYMEFHGGEVDEVDEQIMATAEMMSELGASEDDAWCATNSHEMERLKAFRHATPELVNLLIDERRKTCPNLTKLGTDMSVPDHELRHIMQTYHAGLNAAGLEYVMFGHIGNNHLHVNIIPRDMNDYTVGKELYLAWADEVIRVGGSVSAEHGIGKIKVPFLERMLGRKGIEEMRQLKKRFDPDNQLGRGNLFA